MLNRNQISKVAAFAKGHPIISAIYLFGSHASGHARSRSDVDLGVLFKRDVNGFTRINLETEISKFLKAPWSWARIFKIIPRPWRDRLYHWIARNRHKFGPKKHACPVPTEAMRKRMI